MAAELKRCIVTARKIPYEARDVAHEGDVMETYRDVHYAESAEDGAQVSYSVDLDLDGIERFERASNFLDIVVIPDHGLGASDNEPVPDEVEQPDAGGVREKFWRRPGIVLNQGSEGACTGFAATNFLNVAPLPGKRGDPYALDVYRRAQEIDEWPGTSYSGSSVNAACKVLKERRFIDSFAASQSDASIMAWVKSKGPVMLSTAWFEGMYRTDYRGFIRPTGRLVGGHAILASGVSRWNTLQLFNSWGPGFGDRGCGWLSESDRQILKRTRAITGYMAVQRDTRK